MLYRTHLELNGIKCAELSGNEPQKSILSSRSFGAPQTDYNVLARAIAGHCATAAEKLMIYDILQLALNFVLKKYTILEFYIKKLVFAYQISRLSCMHRWIYLISLQS